MLNPIPLIKTIYQLDTANGLEREQVEQHEAELGVQLPAPLYHYLLELGNAKIVNESYHQFVQLPFEKLDEYLVIGKTCDDDGVWGIHQDELKAHNPMIEMSRNFDSLEVSEVHWFNELPLTEFLLAQAISNGVNGGLNHHAQIYDFAGDTIPADLGEKLATLATEISDIHRTHERFFQAEDFGVVMMLAIDEGKPTAFLMGSQNQDLFETWIHKLAL